MTPTEKYLTILQAKGYKVLCQGGEGFILPRYWHMQRPDQSDFWATKTTHLRTEVDKCLTL